MWLIMWKFFIAFFNEPWFKFIFYIFINISYTSLIQELNKLLLDPICFYFFRLIWMILCFGQCLKNYFTWDFPVPPLPPPLERNTWNGCSFNLFLAEKLFTWSYAHLCAMLNTCLWLADKLVYPLLLICLFDCIKHQKVLMNIHLCSHWKHCRFGH